eukprot:1161827-Pelagomonas_calceolata.AAC.1
MRAALYQSTRAHLIFACIPSSTKHLLHVVLGGGLRGVMINAHKTFPLQRTEVAGMGLKGCHERKDLRGVMINAQKTFPLQRTEVAGMGLKGCFERNDTGMGLKGCLLRNDTGMGLKGCLERNDTHATRCTCPMFKHAE